MKVWIDKQGGTHYHKASCVMITPHIWIQHGKVIPETLPPINFHYEEIEHKIRLNAYTTPKEIHGEYQHIIVDGKRYIPCPICFGNGDRK